MIHKLHRYLFEFANVYIWLEIVSALLLFTVAIIYTKALVGSNYRFLLQYSLIVFVFEIGNNLLSAYSKNNHDLYLIFYMIESALFSLFYAKFLNRKGISTFILVCLVLNTFLVIKNLFFKNDLMDDISVSTISITMISITIVTFFVILSDLKIKNLFGSSIFWFNSANLIYFAGRFFVFLFIYELSVDTQLTNLWYIASIVILLHRLMLCIAISKTKHIELAQIN